MSLNVAPPDPTWRPTDRGWEYAATSSPTESFAGMQYLSQLIDEGFAETTEVGAVIPWERLYRLLQEPDHHASLPLLCLPEPSAMFPRLETEGSPRDADFQIFVVEWRKRGANVPTAQSKCIGGYLATGSANALLSEDLWRLTVGLKNLATRGPTMSAAERLQAAGEIRRLAIAGGALLDDYLQSTEIVSATSLEVDLHKTTVLSETVVQVSPRPIGAPQEWLTAFDRYPRVQKRYDVTTSSGGIAHVVLSDDVVAALEPIKQMPGRRVASDAARALIQNPYAALGDAAEGVLLPESFERARREAGIRFKTLEASSNDRAGCEVLIIDLDGGEADIQRRLGAVEVADLLKRAEHSLAKGLLLFTWDGEEIELNAQTQTALGSLKSWLSLASAGLSRSQVFDLSAYSDRVVGFDGKLIMTPYVALRNARGGWIPENIESGVLVTDPSGTVPSRYHPLTADQISQMTVATEAAERTAESTITLPGSEARIPTAQARAWIDAFAATERDDHRRLREPSATKDPPPSTNRPLLKILHNIESLDYGAEPSVPPVPEGLPALLPGALRPTVKLLPHQTDGLAWLQHRYQQQSIGVSGCLLADDMGLGKTLQALCLLIWSRERSSRRTPSLVVAPVSLLDNWRAEIAKFMDASAGPVLSLYGPALKAARLSLSQIDGELKDVGLRNFLKSGFETGYSLVLTTYETLRDYEFSLARVHWDVVVCDEAQKIKNPAAIVTRAAKALRSNFKIACTGTPVENSLADLWCLFDFFQPGLLGSLNAFTREYRRSIETRQAGHEPLVEALRRSIEPWIMRRMKSEVTQLPPKFERFHAACAPEHMRLPMSSLQMQLYKSVIAELRKAASGKDSRSLILPILHRLRVICSNPLAMANPISADAPLEDHLRSSPKLAWLLGRLETIRQQEEKAIVFTEFRELQRILQRAISSRFNIAVAIVNGSTSVDPENDASRQRIIDQFQAMPGFNVIVLSTTAVGFGVNIQAANHVIHFTRPWNPAKEDQATDRAYRIGQTKPVHVYCPTVVGNGFESFDQRVDHLLGEKRALSRDMLAGVQELTATDFRDL